MGFVLPGASDRTTIIGPTGTGKTILGSWFLSKQRFDKRPWVALDFKDEELWDDVGDPPMRRIDLGTVPKKNGLYRLEVRPGQDDDLERWLWKVWERGNIGLFADEISLVPKQDAFKAILRQGRSKLIPVIACTQRPVDCDREVFTESQYIAVFPVEDIRDAKTIEGFTRNAPIRDPLPRHWSYWIDRKNRRTMILQPCPAPDKIAAELRAKVPYSWLFG